MDIMFISDGEAVFDVDRAHEDRDAPEGHLHDARQTDEQHGAPVMQVDQQRQQKQEHPHNAGVQAVQQAEDKCDGRQAELAQTQAPKQWDVDGFGHG
jgi:hypothetical protein